MHSTIGKYIIFAGITLIIIGLIVYFFGDKLGWLGYLPGDIRIKRGNVRVYFPIVTMILVSIILTILINILKKLF